MTSCCHYQQYVVNLSDPDAHIGEPSTQQIGIVQHGK